MPYDGGKVKRRGKELRVATLDAWAGRTPSPADRGTVRQRKRSQARAQVVQTAVTLIEEHGFAGVTVEDIVSAAGTSRSSFFRYFSAKEDVLFGDDTARRAALHTLDAAHPSDDPWRDICAAVLAMTQRFTLSVGGDSDLEARCVDLWTSHPAPLRRSLELANEWENAICRFLAIEWRLDPLTDVSCRAVAAMLTGAFRAAQRGHRNTNAADAAHAAIRVIEHGLGAHGEAPDFLRLIRGPAPTGSSSPPRIDRSTRR